MKTKSLLLYLILGLSLPALAYVLLNRTVRPAQPGLALQLVKVDRGTIESQLRVTGLAASEQKVVLAAEESARVSEVLAQTGRHVTKGEALLSLDSTDIQAEQQIQQAQLQQAEADMSSRRVQRDAVHQDMLAGGESRERVKELDLQLRSLEARRDTVRADAGRLQLRLKKRSLSAPVSGVVVSVDIKAGETAQAGKPLLAIIPENSMQVLAKIEPADAAFVKEGMSALIALDGHPETEVREKVIRINPAVEREGSTDYLAVWLSLAAGGLNARFNQQLDVRILTGSAQTVIRVPVETLFSKAGKSFVWLLVNGKLKQQAVVVGMMGDRYAEIRSGLEAGQTIVVPQGEMLSEGTVIDTAHTVVKP
ncbi:MAG: efflux RND transporter periplasmic adaptor subunit [Undibacterium curvum]|uniref:efflux RND transporter periplasmic adaptor subunit n=1 Tax=Undibacterium curvum TaxID=2762294 RepID=UPI003BCF6D83